MPDYKREELKQLLTAAELKLVESSRQPALSNLSEAKLKKLIDLTRKARDKWRDQSTRQRRDGQRAQGSRVTDAAARSGDKHKILAKALGDLQKQFDKIGSGATEPGTKAPSPKAPSKRKRAQGHRESRAEVRALLEEKRTKLTDESSAKQKAAKKKVAKKKAAKKTVAKKKVAKQSAATKGTATKKKKVKKKAVKKTPAKKVAAKPAAAKKKVAVKKKKVKKNSLASTPLTTAQADRLNLNPSDQRAAKTKAKAARIQKSGLTTRRQAHTSARGKRSQGRRDSRG